jgi:translation initiation factor 5
MGGQHEYKGDKNGQERCIINGEFEQSTLQNSLDKFIEKFVLCKKCK